MENINYKTFQINNKFTNEQIEKAFFIIKKAGIECINNKGSVIFNFDKVNLKYLEKNNIDNPILKQLLDKLHSIKSYSSSNGKIVYASYNKNKKVSNKKDNSKIRLGYESFKKNYPKQNNILPANILNKIYCDDSLDFLKTLPDNCIDIILTSPPYNFGINYNNTNDVNTWQNYFNALFDIFKECVRVLKDSGRIIINVQPLFSDYIPTHHIISNFFIEQGLIWKGEVIWEKNNYNCKYCSWGSWQSPASPYLKYSWEFIEIFCKNSLKKIGEKSNIDITGDEFKKFVYGKWSIAPERRMKEFKHNAMFPEELVRRCLKLFSYKKDIVLDPFNGAGTTTKVAKELERNFIGIDIDKTYCDTAEKRLLEVIDLFNSM